jgi:hypothetical protein
VHGRLDDAPPPEDYAALQPSWVGPASPAVERSVRAELIAEVDWHAFVASPHRRCRHPGAPCNDPACSPESFDRWAREMGRLDAARLEEVRGEGRRCFEATLKFLPDVGPLEIKPGWNSYIRAMQKERRGGLDVQFHGIFHPRGGDGGGPHYHLLFHTPGDEAELEKANQRCWRAAPGSAHQVHFGEIANIAAATRYFFAGAGLADGRPILLGWGLPFRRTVCTKGFFGVGGRKGLEERLRARSKGKSAAEHANEHRKPGGER